MTKERRLGRGLEALLGNLPARNEPNASAQFNRQPAGAFDASYVGLDSRQPAVQPFADHPREMLAVPPGQAFGAETPSSALRAQPQQQRQLEEEAPSFGPQTARIADIERNPAQPRQEFDPQELQALSESIAEHGLLQPIVVREVGGRFQLIAGERRLRAAELAGWTEAPIHIVEADDRQSAELAIIENLQRKDLNPLEKAASFQRYLEQYGCTQDDLAARLNIDRSTIANLIRLLELPSAVQKSLRKGEITQGHARALLPLGEEREQIAFCERIKKEGLNVRQTEAMVQEMIDDANEEPLAVVDREGNTSRTPRQSDEHIAQLEQEFRTALGIKKVQIRANARGRGKLVIHFRNHDEFEMIQGIICAPHRPEKKSRAG